MYNVAMHCSRIRVCIMIIYRQLMGWEGTVRMLSELSGQSTLSFANEANDLPFVRSFTGG